MMAINFFPWFIAKRTMTLSSLFFFSFIYYERDYNIIVVVFFLPCFVAKRMTTSTIVFFFSLFEKKKTMVTMSLFFSFLRLL
jgi:hypothetical protein